MAPLMQIIQRQTNVFQFILLTPAIGGHVTVADLIGQPLKVLRQVSVLVSIGDDLDALVKHVVAQLLELSHILSPHEHEVLEVRLVFNRLQEQSLEGCVVYCAAAAQKDKGFGLVQLLNLTLQKTPSDKAVLFHSQENLSNKLVHVQRKIVNH